MINCSHSSFFMLQQKTSLSSGAGMCGWPVHIWMCLDVHIINILVSVDVPDTFTLSSEAEIGWYISICLYTVAFCRSCQCISILSFVHNAVQDITVLQSPEGVVAHFFPCWHHLLLISMCPFSNIVTICFFQIQETFTSTQKAGVNGGSVLDLMLVPHALSEPYRICSFSVDNDTRVCFFDLSLASFSYDKW